ncbi:hypothetical protein N7520_001548 [Penicillium odoratum]|uniref:uncharacterized protein n=1 Tax=Penicillium odoratum TaxID=1167516 RepID=UPI0025469EB0|nr:uncharacterized protein N7520_001548 [Penicillium odoratum]KAJ5778302.1 hypothetical protein N7520_001548 [Penicillium odoratum]
MCCNCMPLTGLTQLKALSTSHSNPQKRTKTFLMKSMKSYTWRSSRIWRKRSAKGVILLGIERRIQLSKTMFSCPTLLGLT